MQFGHTYDLVMSGVKTQTRRVWQPGDITDRQLARDASEWADLRHIKIPPISMVVYTSTASGKLRIKYQVGKTYSAQPGRGRKAGGRILLTGIRSERVQDITNEDALAEGMGWVGESSPRDNYAELWDIVHTRPGERWNANPLTWVLMFELVDQPNP